MQNQKEVTKDPGRVAIVKKIEQFEKEAKWSIDVEDDPPAPPLMPEMVDYMNKKLLSYLWMKFANFLARAYINNLLNKRMMIIKEVRGLENYVELKNKGAFITCNHFNAFDNFAVYKAIEKHVWHRELVKVCREGNYTNFPGFFGFLFKHCNTLPLSSVPSTMKLFMHAVKSYLSQGRQILIYPEQAMWWNYRKPRPLTIGTYKMAAENNVPVLPFFITMSDSEVVGPDGFFVQEYTVHILKPIYPKPELSLRQNANYMREQNYAVWKELYEKVYNVPLVYSSQNEAMAE